MDERHYEWLNLNSLRKYPFVDYIQNDLPNNFILDINLTIPNTIETPLYIASIYITPAILSISIKDKNNNIVGIGTIAIDYDNEYMVLSIEGNTYYASGTIIIGTGISEVIDKGMYRLNYNIDQTELLEGTIAKYNANYVEELLIEGNETKLKKSVFLYAGAGVNIDFNKESNDITFSLENPEHFYPECYVDCNYGGCTPPAIHQINNVFPDANGNLTIENTGIITKVYYVDNVIYFGTPEIGINDLCENKNKGARGDPGNPGNMGDKGNDGILVCGEADCCCEVCDNENIDECG